MKTLKKTLLLCLTLALVLCLVACSSDEKTAESNNTSTVSENDNAAAPADDEIDAAEAEPTSYDLSGKEDHIDGQTFDGDVIITGEKGTLTFTNCTFNANIINNGGEGAKVFVWEDCSFAAGAECIIDTSLEEATQDTDLPKFMIFCDLPEVTCEKAGAVIAPAEQAIQLNGTEYPVDNAEYYMNESTGEFAPYSGQEVNMHNFAMWTENGEAVQMHVAVYSAE